MAERRRLVVMSETEHIWLGRLANHISQQYGMVGDANTLRDHASGFESGLTEEEAQVLCDHPSLLSPLANEEGTFPNRVRGAVAKLRTLMKGD